MASRFLGKFAATTALALALFSAAPASAHLMISPQRFVFEEKQRQQTIMLLNDDTVAHTYRLVWKMMKMDETGLYHDMPLDDSNPYTVPKMVVYSPRSVTLAAGGRQNVRMSLRAPANLPAGEYRAHLDFEQMPDEEPARKQGEPDKEGQTIKLKIAVSVTVPVIVRSGSMNPGNISISNAQLGSDGKQQLLKLDLGHQAGHGSAYGQVKVNVGGKQVGILTNVAIYPEMDKRIVNIPLTEALPAGSNVTVAFEGDGEYKGHTLAQQQVTVR